MTESILWRVENKLPKHKVSSNSQGHNFVGMKELFLEAFTK